MKLKIISFVFLILFSLACSGGQSDGGTDVGTIVTNPSSPTTPKVTTDLTLAPDFSKLPMETFLVEATAGSPGENQGAEEENLFVKFWNHYLQSIVITILVNWEEEEDLLKAISDTLLQENITINDALQTITLASPYLIWGANTQKVGVILDSANSDYIRIYGYDATSGFILWHYLVKLDSNNQAVKGIITFINPLAGVLRSVELIFDLTNTDQSLIALRIDKKHPVSGNFHGIQMHQQCSPSECIVEYVTAKEEKIDTGTHFRFSYNNQEVCLGAFGKDPLSDDIVKTFGVEGSLYIDATTEVTKDTCIITNPVWDGQLFTLEKLPDLETYLSYLGDGTSLEGWNNSITPTLIDNCLSEAACEP